MFQKQIKIGYSEKATKFKKIFHLRFDVTEYRQILSGRFFQILWPSQNIRTLMNTIQSTQFENSLQHNTVATVATRSGFYVSSFGRERGRSCRGAENVLQGKLAALALVHLLHGNSDEMETKVQVKLPISAFVCKMFWYVKDWLLIHSH